MVLVKSQPVDGRGRHDPSEGCARKGAQKGPAGSKRLRMRPRAGWGPLARSQRMKTPKGRVGFGLVSLRLSTMDYKYSEIPANRHMLRRSAGALVPVLTRGAWQQQQQNSAALVLWRSPAEAAAAAAAAASKRRHAASALTAAVPLTRGVVQLRYLVAVVGAVAVAQFDELTDGAWLAGLAAVRLARDVAAAAAIVSGARRAHAAPRATPAGPAPGVQLPSTRRAAGGCGRQQGHRPDPYATCPPSGPNRRLPLSTLPPPPLAPLPRRLQGLPRVRTPLRPRPRRGAKRLPRTRRAAAAQPLLCKRRHLHQTRCAAPGRPGQRGCGAR